MVRCRVQQLSHKLRMKVIFFGICTVFLNGVSGVMQRQQRLDLVSKTGRLCPCLIRGPSHRMVDDYDHGDCDPCTVSRFETKIATICEDDQPTPLLASMASPSSRLAKARPCFATQQSHDRQLPAQLPATGIVDPRPRALLSHAPISASQTTAAPSQPSPSRRCTARPPRVLHLRGGDDPVAPTEALGGAAAAAADAPTTGDAPADSPKVAATPNYPPTILA
jgi:hypothetical protein